MAYDQNRKDSLRSTNVESRDDFVYELGYGDMQFEEAECLAYQIALRVLSKIEDPFASVLNEARVQTLLSA